MGIHSKCTGGDASITNLAWFLRPNFNYMVPVLVPLYILLCIIYSFGIKFYLKKKKKEKKEKEKKRHDHL